MINDAHCHFFSTAFFQALARQVAGRRGEPPEGGQRGVDALCSELHWDNPGTSEALADRWVQEMDASGVQRAAMIASIPGDEASVAVAVGRHPSRIVGFFMLDPSTADAPVRIRHAVHDQGLKGLCLFPAMHHVPLDDDRTLLAVEAVASCPGAVVFVHCGVLSVGVRRKLGLPSPFDLRLGDPLAVSRLALAFPQVPFIVPHFGAGLLREVLMAAEACANVYFDTSSSNSWVRYTPGLTLDAVFKVALAVAGPTRLLFGSDSSFFPRGWQRGIYEEQAQIVANNTANTDEAALIFGGNFDRLFPTIGLASH